MLEQKIQTHEMSCINHTRKKQKKRKININIVTTYVQVESNTLNDKDRHSLRHFSSTYASIMDEQIAGRDLQVVVVGRKIDPLHLP